MTTARKSKAWERGYYYAIISFRQCRHAIHGWTKNKKKTKSGNGDKSVGEKRRSVGEKREKRRINERRRKAERGRV